MKEKVKDKLIIIGLIGGPVALLGLLLYCEIRLLIFGWAQL